MAVKISRSESPLATFYVEKQPWLLYRACADMPIEAFFDDCEQRDTTAKQKAIRLAIATCKLCPVRRDCAEQAMKEEGSGSAGRYGVRGCLTPTQRRKLYRNGGLRGRDPKRVPLT